MFRTKDNYYDKMASDPINPEELHYAVTVCAIEYIIKPDAGIDSFYQAVRKLTLGYLSRWGVTYTSVSAVMGVLDCVGRRLGVQRVVNVKEGPYVRKVQKELATIRGFVYDNLADPLLVEANKKKESPDVSKT